MLSTFYKVTFSFLKGAKHAHFLKGIQNQNAEGAGAGAMEFSRRKVHFSDYHFPHILLKNSTAS